jgi:ankyrin repeat protein
MTLFLGLGLTSAACGDPQRPAGRGVGSTKPSTANFKLTSTAKLKQMLESVDHSVHGVYVASQAERLLRDGADPNVADSSGSTVMHFAAGRGDLRTLTLSLKVGGKANASDRLGNTPLHNAACSGDVKAMSVLLAGGASINPKSHSGMTPIDMANRLGRTEAERFLRARGGQLTLGVKKPAANSGHGGH